MKTLIIGLIFFFGTSDNGSQVNDYQWVLDEMEPDEILVDMEFQINRIKIFDDQGNLVGQYAEQEFIENKLPLDDMRIILDSDFLFEFQGDTYYFKS